MRVRLLAIAVSVVSAVLGAGLGLATPVPTRLTSAAAEAGPPPGAPPDDLPVDEPVVPTTSRPDVTTTTTAASPPPDPVSTDPPPVPDQYAVAANEARAEAKAVATRVVHELTNYELGTSLDELVERVTDDPLIASPLARRAAVLHHADAWSRGEIVYPQLGGLSAAAASVMVVVRQDIGVTAEPLLTQTRTLDVRLRLVGGEWTFDHLAGDGGPVVPRPDDLSPEAVAVLDDPRIELPDSARWDIYRGETSPVLLRLMSELADITPFGVVVLTSGHPHNVFATDRVSNHTVGRAVDIYVLGDTRVIDDRAPGSATNQIVEWLNQRPDVYELGSPWLPESTQVKTFTNEVHQDHIHIAVHAAG